MVSVSIVVWGKDVTLCSLVDTLRRCGGTVLLSSSGWTLCPVCVYVSPTVKMETVFVFGSCKVGGKSVDKYFLVKGQAKQGNKHDASNVHYRCKWTQHLSCRVNNTRVSELVHEYSPAGRRSVGRPRKRWTG